MEQKIQQKLLDLLIDGGIEYHARRKIRTWCDCSYCNAKRQGTATIAYGTKRWSHGRAVDYLVPGYILRCVCTDGCPGGCMKLNWDLPPCDNIDDAIRNRMERIRERLRQQLRTTLYNLKRGL